ncbi:uncharacterized protein LOC141692048 [Apium graveolens]|uniref:uncharacterized protein LOC141692048 n=1 Tax=Apium graveolens TaxID=4045 RepID=UPI003D78C231
MSCLSWNCHGLGTPWALQFLKELTLQKSPDFIFLSEILCKHDRVDKVRNLLGFEGAFTVEPVGRSGGISLLWRNKQEITIKSFSKNHIDTVVEPQGGIKYRLTGMYGEPDHNIRIETWDLIRNLISTVFMPWVIIGDLNNIVRQTDKNGGRPYPSWLVEGFNNCITECGLHDLDLEVYPFTWERGYGTKDWI